MQMKSAEHPLAKPQGHGMVNAAAKGPSTGPTEAYLPAMLLKIGVRPPFGFATGFGVTRPWTQEPPRGAVGVKLVRERAECEACLRWGRFWRLLRVSGGSLSRCCFSCTHGLVKSGPHDGYRLRFTAATPPGDNALGPAFRLALECPQMIFETRRFQFRRQVGRISVPTQDAEGKKKPFARGINNDRPRRQ